MSDLFGFFLFILIFVVPVFCLSWRVGAGVWPWEKFYPEDKKCSLFWSKDDD